MPTKRPVNKNSFLYSSHTPINDWLKSLEFKNDRLWRMKKGVMVTVVDGVEMTATDFDNLYPVPVVVSFNRCSENADPRNNYLS